MSLLTVIGFTCFVPSSSYVQQPILDLDLLIFSMDFFPKQSKQTKKCGNYSQKYGILQNLESLKKQNGGFCETKLVDSEFKIGR